MMHFAYKQIKEDFSQFRFIARFVDGCDELLKKTGNYLTPFLKQCVLGRRKQFFENI